MRSFEEYECLQQYFMNLGMQLAMIQEEMTPELFAPLADGFLKELKQAKQLFDIENNPRQQKREARYRYRLLKRGWRKRIKAEFAPKESEFESVKDKVESEQGERINSVAVYAQLLDSEEERLRLESPTEEDTASVGLIAESSEVLPAPTEVDKRALPVDLGAGATEENEADAIS